MPGGPVTEVRLLGVPLRTREHLSRYTEGLLRELALVRISGQQGSGSSLPERLLELAAELETTYAPYRAQRAQDMDDALAAGVEFFDATYLASKASAGYVRHLQEVLEEADEYCRAEHLLTLPIDEELLAFRRWLFGEISRQLAGQDPHPWRGPERRDRPGADSAAAPPPVSSPTPARPSAPVAAGPATAGGAEAAASGVVGQPLHLTSLAGAVAAARRYVRETLRRLDAEEAEECAELGVSELVTNAVLHARTDFTVTVRLVPTGRIRVEVADSSPVPVQSRRFGATATTGRGLRLVAAASLDWGTTALPADLGPGKVVWFEPATTVAGAASPAEEWSGEIEELL
ncbi:ATP-binding protein [Kineococcus auxinigenes]|uniref:ATP-binding protein n=1 Tax=unclassified Kineococcus TaxID=2621656 RepID=UPI003D7CC1BF